MDAGKGVNILIQHRMRLLGKSSLKVCLRPSWGDFSQRDTVSFLSEMTDALKARGLMCFLSRYLSTFSQQIQYTVHVC